MAQFARMILLLLNQASHRLRGENLLHSFGLVKAAVIHRELALSRLSVDFDEPFAEPDVAPAVILLCLDRSSYNRINARHRNREQRATGFEAIRASRRTSGLFLSITCRSVNAAGKRINLSKCSFSV